MSKDMNRRNFLQQATIAGAATALDITISQPVDAKGVNWPIGCFNRPWTKWSFDQTLKEIKAAGYKTTGLLSRTKDEPFISADATPEYLENLKKRIASIGLKANMGALRSRHNVPIEESIREVRKQIDNAKLLSLQYVLSFGADKPEEFVHYFKVIGDAAGYAQEKGIKLVMKPHGGISGSSAEILRCIK
ncbi:MAG: twin-arginine translocation signal domain-containing protein, partial [Blastocatellia bacterium]